MPRTQITSRPLATSAVPRRKCRSRAQPPGMVPTISAVRNGARPDPLSRQTHGCMGFLTFDTRGLFSLAWEFLRMAL